MVSTLPSIPYLTNESNSEAKAEALTTLEQKTVHLAQHFQDPKYANEMLDAIKQAKTESQLRHNSSAQAMAVTDIPSRNLEPTFSLEKLRDQGRIWDLKPSERGRYPEYLSSWPFLSS